MWRMPDCANSEKRNKRSKYICSACLKAETTRLPYFDLLSSLEIESPRLSLVERNLDDVSRLICPYHACSLGKRTLDNTKTSELVRQPRRNRRSKRVENEDDNRTCILIFSGGNWSRGQLSHLFLLLTTLRLDQVSDSIYCHEHFT